MSLFWLLLGYIARFAARYGFHYSAGLDLRARVFGGSQDWSNVLIRPGGKTSGFFLGKGNEIENRCHIAVTSDFNDECDDVAC